MNTRALMTLSAAFLAVLGVGITFMPQELLAYSGVQAQGVPLMLVQLLGALCLGFAILNWMSRGAHIGGIYARPLSMANFFNFAIGALALARGAFGQGVALEVIVVAGLYAAFALWFGVVLFTHLPAPAR